MAYIKKTDNPKMGRPKACNPKGKTYSIRIDEETEQRLSEYCKNHGITKGEAYRKGINMLLSSSDL